MRCAVAILIPLEIAMSGVLASVGRAGAPHRSPGRYDHKVTIAPRLAIAIVSAIAAMPFAA
eukprot:13035369-Alexandrium_andersonii.AAC.1